MYHRFNRLSLADRSSLRIERPATPTHIAGLCIVEAAPLLDEHGELDLATIKRRLEQRLGRVPALRHIVQAVPPLCGPPLWVDDPSFSLDRHVHGMRLDLPGDEAALLTTAELLLRPLLDRTHPLWELWFLTGLDGGRQIGVLFKVHHAVADGLAAVALIMALLDLEPDAPDPPAESWHPMPGPPVWALMRDNLTCRLAAVRKTLAHPVRLARTIGSTLTNTLGFVRTQGTAPRTSLNALPGAERRLRVVHLDLE
ncbi:MAG TPA: wax ester/triacylglycerol synthase domain-containing protein, partial [Ktedonobacterales bacterium]|nr:wax ester/triacylglycerol synthase domain-containing protein [Ktedonobacterales bacterium]